MTTLKQELEAAILKVGSRGAMPGTQRIVIANSDTTNLTTPKTYVAPSDGYIYAAAKNGNSNVAGNVHLHNQSAQIPASSFQPEKANTRVKIFLPAKKGDTLQISSYVSNFIVNEIIFFKSVEGIGLSG